MIRKMRIKIILIATGALILLMSTIFITTNIYMGQIALKDINSFLDKGIANEGVILLGEEPKNNLLDHQTDSTSNTRESRPPDSERSVSGFSIKVTFDGQVSEVFYNNESVSETVMQNYIRQIIQDKKFQGEINNYKYKTLEKGDGYIMVFGNTTTENQLLDELLKVSLIIASIGVVVLFILIVILSMYITKPAETAMDKQKNFIANSSHELKTPLSVMSANLDLLEMEMGSNRRIDAISVGITRMNTLINELLLLARTEQDTYSFKPFNLSNVMESVILPLEVIAYEQGNEFILNIEENTQFNGDEESIRKMIGALMENAIKYSRKNTKIIATLYSKGDSKIIEFYNEGIGVTKDQKDKLFDKFYRVDDSRQRETGGHGIGLSIVKNIVDMHKGKIHVESIPDDYILFRIILHG